jgi:hypothetical protein
MKRPWLSAFLFFEQASHLSFSTNIISKKEKNHPISFFEKTKEVSPMDISREKASFFIDKESIFYYSKLFYLRKKMENLAENNLIRFKNITKKKESLFANFRVKGIRGGVEYSSSISVDISALELHPGDSLENIIEQCGKKALREFKQTNYQMEDLTSSSTHLGVAQLG